MALVNTWLYNNVIYGIKAASSGNCYLEIRMSARARARALAGPKAELLSGISVGKVSDARARVNTFG